MAWDIEYERHMKDIAHTFKIIYNFFQNSQVIKNQFFMSYNNGDDKMFKRVSKLKIICIEKRKWLCYRHPHCSTCVGLKL